MKTETGVSTAVAASSVLLTVVLFTAVYGALMVVTIYLLRKYAKTDPIKDALPVSAY
jgi:cytochrome bd-type quinol oxidase subunit 1